MFSISNMVSLLNNLYDIELQCVVIHGECKTTMKYCHNKYVMGIFMVSITHLVTWYVYNEHIKYVGIFGLIMTIFYSFLYFYNLP